MYAIIETGGKQFRVEKGNEIDVELLSQSEGRVEFEHVLLLNNGSAIQTGTPYLAKGTVVGEILRETKGPKVFSFKYKKRKGFSKKKGHRQRYSRVKITEINA